MEITTYMVFPFKERPAGSLCLNSSVGGEIETRIRYAALKRESFPNLRRSWGTKMGENWIRDFESVDQGRCGLRCSTKAVKDCHDLWSSSRPVFSRTIERSWFPLYFFQFYQFQYWSSENGPWMSSQFDIQACRFSEAAGRIQLWQYLVERFSLNRHLFRDQQFLFTLRSLNVAVLFQIRLYLPVCECISREFSSQHLLRLDPKKFCWFPFFWESLDSIYISRQPEHFVVKLSLHTLTICEVCSAMVSDLSQRPNTLNRLRNSQWP